MAEYQVPQFIEVEDKVIGPFTLKQFIFLAGGLGLGVIFVLYLHFIGIILAIPVVGLSWALGFYKLNGKSFTEILEAGFNYFLNSRLYLWKKDAPQEELPLPTVITPAEETRQKLGLSPNRLHELAWSLDIKDKPTAGGPDSAA